MLWKRRMSGVEKIKAMLEEQGENRDLVACFKASWYIAK
jgi:hypothetical protein